MEVSICLEASIVHNLLDATTGTLVGPAQSGFKSDRGYDRGYPGFLLCFHNVRALFPTASS